MTKKLGSVAMEPQVSFAKSTLSNGIRVVSEQHTHTRAVSIGIWVLTGTRDEKPDQDGISHLLEHLTFKGTRSRTSYQIVKTLEEVGGELNAYTTREYTCYHALILKDHWKRAVEVLADLVSNMNLKESQFQLEKAVVLQELSSSFESHEDHIYDEFLALAYKGNPLGAPILGIESSLNNLTREDVIDYYQKRYVGKNILVSCAGNVDHEDLVSEVKHYLGKRPKGQSTPPRMKPRFKTFSKIIDKPTDQTHLLLGIPTGKFNDPLRFEAFIVNALLGGGMTSKLFQSVRERKGLTYSVYSSLNTFMDAGILMVYAGVENDKLKEVVKTILKSMYEIKEKGVSTQHLKLFKTQVIGSILLGSDDVENRMTSLGINEMVLGRYKPVQEVIDEIQNVNKNSLATYIDKYFQLDNIGGLLLGSNLKSYQSWWEQTLN